MMKYVQAEIVLSMGNCKCEGPPCMCISQNRDTVCEHKECKKDGELKNDCNTFWESKMVLCEEHYLQYKEKFDRPCGLCGTQLRNCVC